MIRVTGMNLS